MTNAWHILGLEPGADERGVKRAYAALLKRTRPEDDAAAYQALREAYEQALTMARRAGAQAAVTETLAVPRTTESSPDGPDWVLTPPETIRGTRARTVDVEPPAVPEPPAEESPALETIRSMRARMVLPEPSPPPAPPVAPEPPPAPPPAEPPVPPKIVAPEVNHAALASAELQAWLAQPAANLRQTLRQRLRGDVLTDLRTREVFELLAARHCAAAHCPETIRSAIVDELGWADDAAHLEQLDKNAIDTALARRRADYSYNALQSRRAGNSALGYLLAGQKPHIVPQMMDARFVRQMRAALEEITWQHQDALRYRLDAELVAWWQHKIDGKRYTAQTLVYSFLAALALIAALRTVLPRDYVSSDAITAFSYSLVVGGTALYSLLAPRSLRAHILRLGQDVLGALMQNDLHGRLVRGWSLVASAATMLLFVPLPGVIKPALLLLCAACGLLLLVPVMVKGLYPFIGAQAVIVGIYLTMATNGKHGIANMLAACTCLATIKLLRIARLHELRDRLGTRAALVPASWLAGCILLVLVYRYTLLAETKLAPLMWLLLLTGIYYISAGMSVFIAIALGITLHFALNYIVLPPAALVNTLPRALEPLLLMLAARAVYDWYQRARGTAPVPSQ